MISKQTCNAMNLRPDRRTRKLLKKQQSNSLFFINSVLDSRPDRQSKI